MRMKKFKLLHRQTVLCPQSILKSQCASEDTVQEQVIKWFFSIERRIGFVDSV